MFVARKLDHYNIRTTKPDQTLKFYVDLLGMTRTAVPGTSQSQAVWICDASGTAVVHLLNIDPGDPHLSYAERCAFRGTVADPPERVAFQGTGAIDHIAFDCRGFDECVAQLRGAAVPFHENIVSGMNLKQIFVKDPNDITLELNFRG
jgi:catechol 2,3-dioxygenase-like lactoylglutathione lyase family enzyme